jgi:hypothetical protein
MNNEEIYIDEIITLWSNEDGVCLSNDYNTVTIRPQALLDWLPSIIEVTMRQKKKDDDDLILQLKHKVDNIQG